MIIEKNYIPEISIVFATAREDYSLRDMPDKHMFEYFLESLREQTFKEFEFIVVDALYYKRRNYFLENPQPFTVKHVYFKDYWNNEGKISISSPFNLGIVFSDGKWVMIVGDCSRLEYNTCLEEIYNECKQYESSIIPLGWFPDGTVLEEMKWTWRVVPLQFYFDINGFDELFDGSKCLEDGDMFTRMNEQGLIPPKVNKIRIRLARQGGLSKSIFKDPICIKCNYTAAFICTKRRERGISQTNQSLTDEEFQLLVTCPKLVDNKYCGLYSRSSNTICNWHDTNGITKYRQEVEAYKRVYPNKMLLKERWELRKQDWKQIWKENIPPSGEKWIITADTIEPSQSPGPEGRGLSREA